MLRSVNYGKVDKKANIETLNREAVAYMQVLFTAYDISLDTHINSLAS